MNDSPTPEELEALRELHDKLIKLNREQKGKENMKVEHMLDPKEEIKLSPEDEKIFQEKMMDLYNFCAERKMAGGAINFKDGLYFECTLVIPNKMRGK